VPCRTTCDEPKDSLEPAFDALFADQPALVDLHHPTKQEKARLPLHQVGSMFANFHGFGYGGVVLDRQYDGILYLPSSTTTKASASAAAVAGASPAANRYVDVIDIPAIVKPVVLPSGRIDRAFWVQIAHPSAFYTDFFGVQALADTTRAGILKDFVPAHATLMAEDTHSLTLRFKAGYTLRFLPHSALSVKGLVVPFDHAYVSGDTWREQQANLAAFRALLEKTGLAARYLVANPAYDAEFAVARQTASGVRAEVQTDPNLAVFDNSPDAVLLAGENVHGDDANFRQLASLLEAHRFDWLGMEMLPSSMQPTLDDFSRAPEGSDAYRRARAALIGYFAESWNGRAGPRTSGEDNYYFKLADLVRRRHARVIGLEGPPLEFVVFRYGETPFGAAVRSYFWAKAAPTVGRGVVFGGSAHMTGAEAHTVEDFMNARHPGRVFVATAPVVRGAID